MIFETLKRNIGKICNIQKESTQGNTNKGAKYKYKCKAFEKKNILYENMGYVIFEIK